MRRFETVRRGMLELQAGSDRHTFDTRILREAGEHGRFFSTTGSALSSVAHASLAEACRSVEQGAGEGAVRTLRVQWSANVAAEPGEKSCFACGAGLGEPSDARARYPERLCPACVLEAVDDRGRELRFENVGLSGGFRAVCTATGEATEHHLCIVRGRKCRADEGRFGGIVVVPWDD